MRHADLLRAVCLLCTPTLTHAVFHPAERSVETGSSVAPADSVVIEASEGTRLAFDVSPDGRWIVFDLFGQIFRIPAIGGAATPLTDAVGDLAEDLDPSYSPDGRWIAFMGDRPSGRALWLISAQGGTPRKLSGGGIGYASRAEAAWSPDGQHLAHMREDTLYVIDLASGAERSVSVNSLPQPGMRRLQWIGGGAIAFTSGYRAGPLFRVDAGGGRAIALGTPRTASAFAHSPDNSRLALIAADSTGKQQVWVQDLPEGPLVQLTNHMDVSPYRVRWFPDGGSVLYSADGKLWRVAAAGGQPTAIPFTGRVAFVRAPPAPLHPISLAAPGSRQTARGFSGLSLSPDGQRIAMIALDSLWVWEVGQQARSVRAAGRTAQRLTWSADGREVAWTIGEYGAEDLHAVNVTTGESRIITALAGGELQPVWSPDGETIAFLHRLPSGRYHLRTVPAQAAPVTDPAHSRDLGPTNWRIFGQEPAWTSDSRGLLTWYAPGFYSPVIHSFVPIEGAPRTHSHFPVAPSFLQAAGDGSVTYVENAALWRAAFSPDSGVATVRTLLTGDAAIYPSVSKDGSVLYVAADGLRLRRPTGTVTQIGWPLGFVAPASPGDLLIRNVGVIDGSGAPEAMIRDILIHEGRIARISTAGRGPARQGTRIIDGAGRWLIPGLIDLHVHLRDAGELPGFLVSGVMTIRDAGTPIALIADIASASAAGLVPGPRVVYGGFQFAAGSGSSGEIEQFLSDSAAIARGVSLARSFGAQYLKHRPLSGWAVSAVIVREAHRQGLRVSGHCTHPLPLLVAAIDGREHTGQCFRDFGILYEDMIKPIRAAGLWVVPTVALYSDYLRVAGDSGYLRRSDVAPFLSPGLQAASKTLPDSATQVSYRRSTTTAEGNARKMFAAGIPLGTGGDSSFPTHLHMEMEGLVRSGLTPSEAIAAATGVAARILGADADLGTVREGMVADLVMLGADPLVDIRNTQRITMLIQAGRVIDRATLAQKDSRPGWER